MRLIGFQIFFIAFSLLAIGNVWKRKKIRELGPKGACFWILFWLGADAVVLWPGITTIIANLFGIGRGSDFILYISIAVMFFILFKLHVKIERMNREVTKIVRKNVLENVKIKN